MYEFSDIVVILAVFLFCGAVKGIVGFGLPVLAIALLSLTFDARIGMVLVLMPAITTNVWQCFVGNGLIEIMRRIWPLLLTAMMAIWIASGYLNVVDGTLLTRLLGLLLMIYALSTLAGVTIELGGNREKWVGPLVGALNGVFTGLTGSLSLPGVLFLNSIDLPRALLRQSMGLLFLVSSTTLMVALYFRGALSIEANLVSALSVIPALIGMMFGEWLGKYLSERLFRRIFLIGLTMLGAMLILNG
ncbi:MAG: sulfite exporter TauE/SafE family protein [Rhizobiaceae bacterium]